MKKNELMKSIKVLIFVLCFSVGLSSVSAQVSPQWTPPAGTPSATNNVLGPINVGTSAQAKGAIGVQVFNGVSPLLDIQGWLVSDDSSVVDELNVGGKTNIIGDTTIGTVPASLGTCTSGGDVDKRVYNDKKENSKFITKINKFLGLDNVNIFSSEKALALNLPGSCATGLNPKDDPSEPTYVCSPNNCSPPNVCLTVNTCGPIPDYPCTLYSCPTNKVCNMTTHWCETPNIPNPVCGSADGKGFTTTPSSNLCSVGNASSVVGSGEDIGYWSWLCQNGPTKQVSCSADLSLLTKFTVYGNSTFNGRVTAGEVYSNGKKVCLSDGSNCPTYVHPALDRHFGGSYVKNGTTCVTGNPLAGPVPAECVCPPNFQSYVMLNLSPTIMTGCYRNP